MPRRYTFRCWNCDETFELTREIVAGQVLQLECPFCHAELVFDPDPYARRVTTAYRGEGEATVRLVLPDVLPTKPPEPREEV